MQYNSLKKMMSIKQIGCWKGAAAESTHDNDDMVMLQMHKAAQV